MTGLSIFLCVCVSLFDYLQKITIYYEIGPRADMDLTSNFLEPLINLGEKSIYNITNFQLAYLHRSRKYNNRQDDKYRAVHVLD